MRKLRRNSIQPIIKRAFLEFLADDSAPDFLTFCFNGRYVDAVFAWSSSFHNWYLSHFDIYYPRCVVRYEVLLDYDLHSALLPFEK